MYKKIIEFTKKIQTKIERKFQKHSDQRLTTKVARILKRHLPCTVISLKVMSFVSVIRLLHRGYQLLYTIFFSLCKILFKW